VEARLAQNIVTALLFIFLFTWSWRFRAPAGNCRKSRAHFIIFFLLLIGLLS